MRQLKWALTRLAWEFRVSMIVHLMELMLFICPKDRRCKGGVAALQGIMAMARIMVEAGKEEISEAMKTV